MLSISSLPCGAISGIRIIGMFVAIVAQGCIAKVSVRSVGWRMSKGCAENSRIVNIWLKRVGLAWKSRKNGHNAEKIRKNFQNIWCSQKYVVPLHRVWEKTPKVKKEQPVRKFGWVAETSSLLNCRAGYRTGGSNPPASAAFPEECKMVDSSNG